MFFRKAEKLRKDDKFTFKGKKNRINFIKIENCFKTIGMLSLNFAENRDRMEISPPVVVFFLCKNNSQCIFFCLCN